MAYKLSIPATRDLETILQFTLENWGLAQFERYHQLIEETLNEIDTNPDCILCHIREDLFPGGRSRNFGKHVVFYRVNFDQVEVVRVLHQAMDHRSHLL